MSDRREIVVPVPASKSEAIRALIVGALARGTTRIENAPASGDVKAVIGALRALGVKIAGKPGRGELRVHGVAGKLPPGDRRLDLGGSATGLRMLACVALLREGRTTLDGDASLRRRAVGPIFDLFPSLGVRIRVRPYPPVIMSGGPVTEVPESVGVRGAPTSQIPSGMLIAAPMFKTGLRMALEGTVVSRPYLDMTVDVLRRAGVRIRSRGRTFHVSPGVPRAFRIRIESDWSSAAYPLVAAAILGTRVRVPGLRADSRQADRAVLALLRKAGVRCGVDSAGAWCSGTGKVRPFRMDVRDCPDLAPAAAALALFAPGQSQITGGTHLNLKESDRIETCIAGVRALGGESEAIYRELMRSVDVDVVGTMESFADGFTIRGGTPRAGSVNPRGDHRIALAFGIAAAAIPGARVLDRACVAKSWPGAWRDMKAVLRK